MAQQDIYNQDGKISSSVRNKLSNASLLKSSGASLLKQSAYGVDNNDTDKDNNDVLTSLTQQIAQDSKNNAHKGQANATVGDKITGTLVELGYNIVNPFLKLGEGVVDAHAILFNAQDFVKTDWTNTFLQWIDDSTNNKLSKSMKNSYTYDLSDVEFLGTTLDETIRGVEQGIGSSLGGAALSSIPYVGAVLYGMGAGGMALEEAMNEDPNNEESSIASKVGYGILSGATEQLIEWGSGKLQGALFKDKGITSENFGILKSKGKNLRDTMVDLFIDAGFEGAEEVASDCLDPLYQTVYNGKSVADNYAEDWSIEGLTSSFVVGALSGLVMGSSSEALQRTMYSSDGLQAMELINKSVENEMNAKKEFNKVAQSGTTDMVEAVKNYQSKIAISQQMMEKAGELIKGLKPFYQQQLQRKNINFENVNENSEDLKQESSATAQQINYDNSIKPIVENINKIRGNGKELSVEFVDENNDFNGKIVNNTIYLSNSPQKAYRQILSHELSHTLENTNSEYNAIAKQIYDKAIQEGKYQDFAKLYTDKDANIENEVVAEYIADNFFTSYKDIADVFKTKNAKEKLVDLLKGLRKQTGDAKLKQQYLNLIQKLINTKVIEETASRTLTKDQLRNRKAINDYLKSKGDNVEELVKYNTKTAQDNRLIIKRELYRVFPPAKAELILKNYDSLIETWNKLSNELNAFALNEWNSREASDRVGGFFKDQMGYKYNGELASACLKGLSLFDSIDQLVVENYITKEAPLDANSKQILYEILSNHGLKIPCGICYVEEARRREATIIGRFIDGEGNKLGWNQVLNNVEKYVTEKTGKQFTLDTYDKTILSNKYKLTEQSLTKEQTQLVREYLVTRLNKLIDTKNNKLTDKLEKFDLSKDITTDDINRIVDKVMANSPTNNMELLSILLKEKGTLKHMPSSYLMHSMVFRNMETTPMMRKLFNKQGGVSGYKVRQVAEIYDNDALIKSFVDSREAGGIRTFSNSDFEILHLVDWYQYMTDLTIKGEYSQNYTKVLADAKLFGLCGAKINLSLIPLVKIFKSVNSDADITRIFAGLDENGRLLTDSKEGMNEAEARMLAQDKDYSKNCTPIIIGFSEEQFWKVLDDADIRFIIGFHAKSNDPKKRYKSVEYATNFQDKHNNETTIFGTQQTYNKWITTHKSLDGTIKTFSEYLIKAEELINSGKGYMLKKASYESPIEYRALYQESNKDGTSTTKETILKTHGKTIRENGMVKLENYRFTKEYNDIPKIAAQMYIDDCYKGINIDGKTIKFKPMYDEFVGHENYYKCLVDYAVYDCNGNYCPHSKVNFTGLPKKVPMLKDGKKTYDETWGYIRNELTDYVDEREKVAQLLADGIIQKEYNMLRNDPNIYNKNASQVDTAIATRNKLNELDGKLSVKDSNGNTLTPEQQAYFKDSKVRDEKGNLLVMYHNSVSDSITTFDINKAGEMTGNFNEKAIWFTPNKEFANKWNNGKVYEVYLNANNLLDLTKTSAKELQDFIPEYNKFDGYETAIKSYLDAGNSRGIKTLLDFTSIAKKYDGIVGRLYSYAQNKGDALEYGVFNANQIKSVDNTNPTSSDDIRYSTKDNNATSLDLTTTEDNFLSTEEKLKRLVETNYKEESTLMQITFGQKASEVATKIANAINTKSDRTAIRNLVTIQVDSIRLDGLTLEEAYDLNNKVDVGGVLVPLSDTFKNYRKQVIEELTDLYIKQYGTKQSVKQLTNKAIYWFKNKIHSISLNNNRVRKIIKNVVNIRQAFKKIYDGKIYGSNRLESAFQSISGQIAKLSFNNTTSKITQDGRAIATSLVDIFNKNRAVIEILKELYKEEIGGQVSYKEYDDKMRRLNLIKDYLAEQIQKYEVIQGKVHIDGLDYDTKLEFPEGHKYEELSGLTEAEMALEVFKVAYDSLRGNQKTFDYIKDGKTETRFVKDEVKTELDTQQEYVRKVGKNKLIRWLKGFTQDVVDTDAYFNVLAYSNKDSFFNYMTERLRAGRDTSYGYYYQIFNPVQKVLESDKNIAKDLKKTKVQYLGKEISLGELIALRLMSETDNAPSHLFGKGIEFSRDVGQATKIDGQTLIDKYVNEMDKQILKNKPKAEEKAQIYENAILQLQSDLDSMIDSKYEEFMFAIREMYRNSTEVYKDASLKINGAYYGTKRVYYPIMSSIYKSIQSFANGTMDVGGFVSNELNPSFTKKANNNATNRIIVNDVLDTALFFADKLSNYAGVTYEVNQLNKVLLYKYNGDTTLSKYIQENVDDKFEKRYNSLVKAMQGISNRESSSFSTIVNYFKNINARYNLGANTKTILSQFLSLPMANIYVSNGNITKGLFNHSKSAMEKIGGISFDDLAKIDPYTRKRYENNNILQADSLIENIADNTITKTMMYPIQWMDRNTISTIWYACQYQSLDEKGKVDIKKAIELYHKAVELTQPQYDALNNGYITRDSSEVMRLLIQFSSVTRKYFSRIFEGAYNLYTSKKLYGKDSVEYKQAKQHYARVIGDFTVATFLIVALTSLLKALKGDYKDDEADEIIKDIAANFGSNIFSLLPIVKDVYNVAISGYDMEIGALSMISDSINAFKNNIPKLFDKNSTRNERTSATWSLMQEISKFCGVPIKNIYNNFQYLFGIIDETTGSQIRVESGLIFYNTGNSTLTELMKVAKSKGKDSQIGGILDSKFYNYINGERLTDTQKKELTRLYKLGVLDMPSATPSKITYTDSFGNEVEVELNKAQRQKFQDVYKLANEGFEQMLNSRYYNSLTDEEKAKAIAKLYDVYYELAKQNVLEKQSTNRLARLSRYINVSKYCIYLSKISSIVATDSASRATQVQNYINRINMSRKEKYLLYYLSGYSREEYKEEALDYLISKGMPRKKAKEFLGIE